MVVYHRGDWHTKRGSCTVLEHFEFYRAMRWRYCCNHTAIVICGGSFLWSVTEMLIETIVAIDVFFQSFSRITGFHSHRTFFGGGDRSVDSSELACAFKFLIKKSIRIFIENLSEFLIKFYKKYLQFSGLKSKFFRAFFSSFSSFFRQQDSFQYIFWTLTFNSINCSV